MRSVLTQGVGKRQYSENKPSSNHKLNLQLSNKLQRESLFRHDASQAHGRSQSPSKPNLGGSTAATIAHIEKR